MTVEQAKELCIEAHKDQWRRPKIVEWYEHVDCISYDPTSTYFTETGSKLIFDALTEDWLLYEPYHTHPIAVAEMMTTNDEKIVALLHDVIEDTEAKIWKYHPTDTHVYGYIDSNNTHYNLGWYVFSALDCITKREGQSYDDYLSNLVTSPIAIKVKIADITCNLLDNPSERQKSKYRIAMQQLLSSL